MTLPRAGLASALALGGLAAAASLVLVGGRDGLFGAALAALAAAIARIDARSFRIPDPLNAALFALGLVAAAVEGSAPGAAAALMRGVVMAGLLWCFRWLYRRLRGVEGLGLGDVKLAAGAGVWLQGPSLPWMVELAAVSGLLFAIAASRLSTFRLEGASRLPFGAFLAPAVWLCWLLERLGWI